MESESRERVRLETELIERNKAQVELEKSEEKYSTIVEKGNDGIIILQDESLKFANSVMIKMTGFATEEFIGKPFINFVAPIYREQVINRYKQRLVGKTISSRYEIDVLTKDGKSIPVEINASLIEYEGKPADMAIIRDMTERKRAGKTLRLSEEKFRNLVENAAVGIATTLPDGCVLTANKAVLDVFGYDTEQESYQDIYPHTIS